MMIISCNDNFCSFSDPLLISSENHPEHRNHWAANKRSRLEKHKSGNVEIISGLQLYINKRTREHLATHSDVSLQTNRCFPSGGCNLGFRIV